MTNKPFILDVEKQVNITISDEGIRWKTFRTYYAIDQERAVQLAQQRSYYQGDQDPLRHPYRTLDVPNEFGLPAHILDMVEKAAKTFQASDDFYHWSDIVSVSIQAPWDEAMKHFHEMTFPNKKAKLLSMETSNFYRVEFVFHSQRKQHNSINTPLTFEQSDVIMTESLKRLMAFQGLKGLIHG